MSVVHGIPIIFLVCKYAPTVQHGIELKKSMQMSARKKKERKKDKEEEEGKHYDDKLSTTTATISTPIIKSIESRY